MRTRPHLSEIFPHWLGPALYFIACMLTAYVTGLLTDFNNPLAPTAHEHSVNSVMGLPLLTSYFWFCLRLMEQWTAGIVMSNLLDSRALCEFGDLRRQLVRQFSRHCLFAALLAIVITLAYAWQEGALQLALPLHSYPLLVMAWLFWFSFCLFGLHITTITRTVIRRFGNPQTPDQLAPKAIERVVDLGVKAILCAAVGIALLAVFWLERPINTIDMMVLALFVGGLTLFLIHPLGVLINNVHQWRNSQAPILHGDKTTRFPESANSSAMLHVEHLTGWPVSVRQRRQLCGAGALIAVLWSLVSLFN